MADFDAFKEYHERGELGFKEWLKSWSRARAFASFAWDDPLPFLVARKFGLSYGRILEYAIKEFLHGVQPLVTLPGKTHWRSSR